MKKQLSYFKFTQMRGKLHLNRYEDMDCCDSEIEAIDLQAEDLSTSDTVTVTWQIIWKL